TVALEDFIWSPIEEMSDLAKWELRGPVRLVANDIAEWDLAKDQWGPLRHFDSARFHPTVNSTRAAITIRMELLPGKSVCTTKRAGWLRHSFGWTTRSPIRPSTLMTTLGGTFERWM